MMVVDGGGGGGGGEYDGVDHLHKRETKNRQ